MKFVRNGNKAFKNSDQEILFRVYFLVAKEHHFDSRQNQKRAENVNHPMKLHQPRARTDEDRAKNQRAQNAVKQNAVLIFRRNRKIAENHHEDKNVVYRKRFFDDVAGQKFERFCPRDICRKLRRGEVIKADVKQKRERNPDNAPNSRFLK